MLTARYENNLYPVGKRIDALLGDIEIKLVNGADGQFMPAYATAGASGLDLRAHIKKEITLTPGEVRLIGTGIALNMKSTAMGAFVFPRSGKGIKEGLILANGTGVIDSDYQGEILVAAWNRRIHRHELTTIQPGERIAQLVFMPIVQAIFTPVHEFSNATDRSANGIGSTGK